MSEVPRLSDVTCKKGGDISQGHVQTLIFLSSPVSLPLSLVPAGCVKFLFLPICFVSSTLIAHFKLL